MHTFVHEPTQKVLGIAIATANSFLTRFFGLMLRKSIPAGTGLFFPKCAAVHTIGMRCAIDILFLDQDFRVTKGIAAAKPLRLFFGPHGTCHTLELPAGSVTHNDIKPGDRLIKV